MDVWRLILAVAGILYGIVKIAIGAISIMLPDRLRRHLASNEYFAMLISDDTTLSAIVIEMALVIFGVYTILNSLDILQIISLPLINTRTFIYTFYGLMGIVLTLFYSAVLYTTLPIPKSPKDTFRYKTIGLLGGIAFIMMALVAVVVHAVEDCGGFLAAVRTLPKTLALVGISLASLTVASASILYEAIKNKDANKDKKLLTHDLVTILFIPVGAF